MIAVTGREPGIGHHNPFFLKILQACPLPDSIQGNVSGKRWSYFALWGVLYIFAKQNRRRIYYDDNNCSYSSGGLFGNSH